MSVDKRFLIERQGKQVVLYQGLLDLAHEMGLVSLRSEILQFPNMDNGGTCYAMATAIFKRNGEEMVFQDFADANAGNVTPAMKNCIPRMAATRAKARCLRDGTNCGVTAFEELGDDTPEPPYQKQERANPPERRPSNVDANGEVHDTPGRPVVSPVQKARAEFRAAARSINEAYGHPSFKDRDAAKMVACICEDTSDIDDVLISVPSWQYATGILKRFKARFPDASTEFTLDSIRAKFCTDLPMSQFTYLMWEDPFPQAGKANSAVVDAATMYQSTADKIRDSLKETANGLA